MAQTTSQKWAELSDRATRANVHRTYISSIELGKVSVGIEVANALAVALGMRLSDLVRRA